MTVDVSSLNHDDVTGLLSQKIVGYLSSIDTANETLLAEEEGVGVRDIDKALKEGVDNEDVSNAWTAAQEARKAYTEALDNARNLYRTEVLGQEAKETQEVDVDEIKETRKLAVEAVTLLRTYAAANNMKDVVGWLESLEIPQVGRKGTSTVGQKKPRAYVHVNGSVHETFGKAAAALTELLSTKDNKVEVTSPDLVQAWENAGEKDEFEFQGQNIRVVPKTKD